MEGEKEDGKETSETLTENDDELNAFPLLKTDSFLEILVAIVTLLDVTRTPPTTNLFLF